VQSYKEKIPPSFDLLKIADVCSAKNEGKDPTPYDTVVQQECEVMNRLLLELFTSLEELELG